MITENLIDKTIKRMPENLNKIEQARYIYISLGKLFTFDKEYWLGNSEQQKKIYYRSISNNIDIEKLKEKRKTRATCIEISKVYENCLKRIGIDATTYQEDPDDRHRITLIKVDNNTYEADLQRDLVYIQTKRDTKYFGYNVKGQEYSINKDKLKQIDAKIGYDSEGEITIKELIENLKSNFKNKMKLSEKVKIALNEVSNIPEVQKMEYVERAIFYRWFLNKVFKSNEVENLQMTDIQIKDKDNCYEDDYNFTITVIERGNEYTRFIYSENDKKYINISEEKFIELAKGKTGAHGKKIQGLNIIKKEDR